jgi:hypothetical protein
VNTRYTLPDYHLAVVGWLTKHIKWLNHVAYYPEINTQLVTPAAYFSVIDWGANERQPMDGGIGVDLNCNITVAVPLSEIDYQLIVRNAAMALSIAVNNNRFGLEIEPATFINSEPETLSPELDDYALWGVRFTQPFVFGDPTCFLAPDIIAKTVMSSQAPDIGTDHEDDYIQIYPDAF